MLTSYANISLREKNIIYVKFASIKPDFDQFENYLIELKNSVISSDQKVFIILDATYTFFLPFELRKKQAQWIKENKDLIIEKVLCTISIIPNSIQRTVLYSIYAIQKPYSPYKIFKDLKQGMEYISSQKELV
ncbi:MAG: hypothetical protein KTR26_00200 [Flammeovirgaceae bacterium]|nr:hypothetical protein [Flammeovirgaceae bacterium]